MSLIWSSYSYCPCFRCFHSDKWQFWPTKKMWCCLFCSHVFKYYETGHRHLLIGHSSWTRSHPSTSKNRVQRSYEDKDLLRWPTMFIDIDHLHHQITSNLELLKYACADNTHRILDSGGLLLAKFKLQFSSKEWVRVASLIYGLRTWQLGKFEPIFISL